MPTNLFLEGNLNNELVRTILNVYLYGEKERPEYFGGHIRDSFERSIVNFNADDFVSTGPGRYVEFSFFSVVQDFLMEHFR